MLNDRDEIAAVVRLWTPDFSEAIPQSWRQLQKMETSKIKRDTNKIAEMETDKIKVDIFKFQQAAPYFHILIGIYHKDR